MVKNELIIESWKIFMTPSLYPLFTHYLIVRRNSDKQNGAAVTFCQQAFTHWCKSTTHEDELWPII